MHGILSCFQSESTVLNALEGLNEVSKKLTSHNCNHMACRSQKAKENIIVAFCEFAQFVMLSLSALVTLSRMFAVTSVNRKHPAKLVNELCS